MKVRRRVAITGLGSVLGLALGLGTPVFAGDDHREHKGPAPATGIVSGWLPNNGTICDGVTGTCDPAGRGNELPLGDLYTLRCREGGMLQVEADTKDDDDSGKSHVDLAIELFDENGSSVAFADDGFPCSQETACGFTCPFLNFACAAGREYSLVVRDFGPATATGLQCSGGGGYRLQVAVWRTMPGHTVRLSPRSLRLERVRDDEGVPGKARSK